MLNPRVVVVGFPDADVLGLRQRESDGAGFCSACGQGLLALPRAREVRKTVTVVFADVTGIRPFRGGWGRFAPRGARAQLEPATPSLQSWFNP